MRFGMELSPVPVTSAFYAGYLACAAAHIFDLHDNFCLALESEVGYHFHQNLPSRALLASIGRCRLKSFAAERPSPLICPYRPILDTLLFCSSRP